MKITFATLIMFVLAFNTSFAQQNDSLRNVETVKTWDRFSVNLGGFVAGVNTGIRFGIEQLGLGIDINLERALGMKTSNFVFRSDAMYRFGKTKKHSVKAGYFSFIRSAEKALETELSIGDHVFPIGTDINSRFDLTIYNVSYDYSFFSDERINLGASAGLFIMPVKFELSVSGITEEATDFLAPLPVFGLRSDFAITSKFYLKQSIELLYLQMSDFTGSIIDVNLRLEHNTWKKIGFGLGLNMTKLRIEAKGKEYPGVSMVGNVEMGYAGILFYGRYYL